MANSSGSYDFTDKRVLIAGGNSDMGEAAAQYFSEAGANVVIIGSNKDRAHKVVEQLAQLHGKVSLIPTNIRQSAEPISLNLRGL